MELDGSGTELVSNVFSTKISKKNKILFFFTVESDCVCCADIITGFQKLLYLRI